MATLRISLIALCALPLAAAADAGTWAVQSVTDATAHHEVAARRGTRNYRPDGGTATTTTPSTAVTAPSASGMSLSDKLDQCMETWDAGTHISKSKWREICQRQLRAGE